MFLGVQSGPVPASQALRGRAAPNRSPPSSSLLLLLLLQGQHHPLGVVEQTLVHHLLGPRISNLTLKHIALLHGPRWSCHLVAFRIGGRIATECKLTRRLALQRLALRRFHQPVLP